MQRGERATEVDPDTDNLASAHRPAISDHCGERLTLDEFHPDADALMVLFGAVDRHDVRVADSGEVARFAQW